ncbi:hypothetical protein NPIL_412701, partial [Nephila pilipes]
LNDYSSSSTVSDDSRRITRPSDYSSSSSSQSVINDYSSSSTISDNSRRHTRPSGYSSSSSSQSGNCLFPISERSRV